MIVALPGLFFTFFLQIMWAGIKSRMMLKPGQIGSIVLDWRPLTDEKASV